MTGGSVQKGRRLGALGLWLLALAGLLATAGRAQPSDRVTAPAEAADCHAALHDAERRHATPPGLLARIALVESGRLPAGEAAPRAWPWTINAGGQGSHFNTKADAVAGVRQAMARGVRLIDVGCMQVNLQMHPGAFRTLEEAFDPVANADYAARYLSRMHAEAGGDWDVAVGYYHSHTPVLASAYRARIAGLDRGIVADIGISQPLYGRALQRGVVWLPVMGGRALLVNVNRQPSLPGRRRPTACEVAAAFAPDMAVPFRMRGCPGAVR